ncbi:DUF4185 domain-containing protein [Antrihabitans cavernicola]|uniref:DUF4185 domain-containing protein n=1 Tax=Antrihabitans cavernicola TaxID=2495913 RepID=UPI001F2542A5|nr:DUF4185 domain-containing protein [Spelaeibacter cavernicola]
MLQRVGTGLCVVAAVCALAAPSSAAPLPYAPPPVNSCGEVGFDPVVRQPDPKAPPAPLIPPVPPNIDIPIPYPKIVPVPEPGPRPDNTRIKPGPLPTDPCKNPCPDVTDKPDDQQAPGPAVSSGSGTFRIPQIQIRPEAEPIPIPVPGGPGPDPQPAPPPVVNPAEAGPVTPPVAAPAAEGVNFVQQLTGHGSENRTDKRYGVDGTDLGLMWESKPGEVAVAFGDTFGKGWKFGVPGGPDWRSNVLGHSTDKNLADGMKIDSMVQDSPCHAAELLSSRKVKNYEMTTIPTSGFAIGDRQYMSYMSINRWSTIPGMWFTNYGGVAYSDDDGQTWTKDQHAKWENIFGLGKFQVATMVPQGDYVYMFGTPNGRIGSVGLARVLKKDVLNTTAYQYWVNGTWAPTDKNDATPIMSGIASELSVRYDQSAKLWQLSTLDTVRGAILIRNAASPQGIWSDGAPLLNTVDYPKAYGGFIHPWSTDKDLYFTISEWDSYNVYLMHARLK